jgi:hypothetical protein
VALTSTATELAENAATPHEIMAITGHQTIEEVERYTKAARRRKMADAAMAKLTSARPNEPKAEHTLSHRDRQRDNSAKRDKKIKGRGDLWRSLGELNPCFSLERAAS